jgi:4-amino-4-deoxy-L-arabinose transferase-like glycosyltransferase
MARAFLTEGLLFLLPFCAFGLLLLLQRRKLLDLEHWSGRAAWLAGAGLALVLASFLYRGFLAERPASGFEPAHMENGQFVPGRFK